MEKLKLKSLVRTILILMILLSLPGNVKAKKNSESNKRLIGQVYTYDYSVEKLNSPSYIKFLDNEHYVAYLGFDSEESFGDGEPYSLIFLEGTYKKTKNEFFLGTNFSRVTLLIPTKQDLKEKKYQRVYKLSKNDFTEQELSSFERGRIKKRAGVWQFQWRTKNNTEPVKYNYGWVKLKKSKKKIPNSIDDLLKEYKKIGDEE